MKRQTSSTRSPTAQKVSLGRIVKTLSKQVNEEQKLDQLLRRLRKQVVFLKTQGSLPVHTIVRDPGTQLVEKISPESDGLEPEDLNLLTNVLNAPKLVVQTICEFYGLDGKAEDNEPMLVHVVRMLGQHLLAEDMKCEMLLVLGLMQDTSVEEWSFDAMVHDFRKAIITSFDHRPEIGGLMYGRNQAFTKTCARLKKKTS